MTKKSRLSSALCLILFFIFLLANSYDYGAGIATYEVKTDSIFLQTNKDEYILVEIAYPLKDGTHPLVFMAHGFAGTINSGGATELSNRLAESGIVACRIDFNPFLEPSKASERSNEYPLRDMKENATSAIDYCIKNYSIDTDRIGLYGRSYGGRLAMIMANESVGGYDYKALGLVAPAGDDVAFLRFMGGIDTYDNMKNEAAINGYSDKLGVKVTMDWFDDVEVYNPCDTGYKFGDKPVLLFYNTLDTVVYPDTSKRCAASYKNAKIIEVTTKDGHGHEMGIKDSKLKDQIMGEIVEFFDDNLLE